jgi:hypothetical protein
MYSSKLATVTLGSNGFLEHFIFKNMEMHVLPCLHKKHFYLLRNKLTATVTNVSPCWKLRKALDVMFFGFTASQFYVEYVLL